MQILKTCLIIIFLLMCFFLLASCSGNEEEKRMNDLLNNRCTACHGLESTKNKKWPEIKWREIIEDMISRGAHLDEAEKESLIKYLSVEHGI